MSKVTKQTAQELKNEFVESVRAEAELRADRTRRELGEIVAEKMGEYFPEATRRRRRRDIASGVVLGVIVGFLVRYVIEER